MKTTYGKPIRDVGEYPRLQTSPYAFVFSDDIKVWIGTHKIRREKNKETARSMKSNEYKIKHDSI